MLRRERRQLGHVADEGVQAAPDLEAVLDRARDEQDPLGGELAARGRDADEQRVRLEREPFVERRDDGDVAAEAEDLAARVRPARVASMTPTTRSGV